MINESKYGFINPKQLKNLNMDFLIQNILVGNLFDVILLLLLK